MQINFINEDMKLNYGAVMKDILDREEKKRINKDRLQHLIALNSLCSQMGGCKNCLLADYDFCGNFDRLDEIKEKFIEGEY